MDEIVKKLENIHGSEKKILDLVVRVLLRLQKQGEFIVEKGRNSSN